MADLNITIPPPSRTRQSGDYQLGVYARNSLITRYVQTSGKMAVAVQGVDGTPCEVLQVSAPYGAKIVKFDVIRFGLMPLVPGPEASDANVVYLTGEVDVEEQTGLDGIRKWYRVSGWYLYAFLKPVFTASGLPFGVKPIDRDNPPDMVLPPEAFVDTMRPLTAAVGSVLGGSAGSLASPANAAPGDDLNRIRKLVPKNPRP